MPTITQATRSLAVASPLGQDVLLLVGFSGMESISRLFAYQLDMLSANEGIAAREVVGLPITWWVAGVDKEPRFFSGFVSRFVAGSVSRRGLRAYRAEVVPWTWFLTRSTDCRIFQNLSTPEIIEAIFGDFGFHDFSVELTGVYPKWEYCVQYRETAFNFISRLMEHEGIFYYFRHAEGKHTLVLADSAATYSDCPEARVNYSPGSLAPNHVSSWERTSEFRSGKWTRTDYNFQTPSTNLLTTTGTTVELPTLKQYELFDYPGEYYVKGVGDPVTKVRMEEEEAGFEVLTGASECCTFTPAGRFTLEGHDVDSENGAYAITSIQHAATETSHGSSGTGIGYSNVFTCIPKAVVFRPARVTPKPMVQGPQTAVVVGPAGEEIYVDKYARIKVQFFWDRKGKKDENSSCWIRVSEAYAGKGWGSVNHPRIGQEVIVDFLEGDPDRPLVTGRVYNAEQMPPYPLPDSKVMSGLKSKTHKGSGYNEFVMNDTAGKELIRVHGQYDMDSTINNDLREHVLNNRSRDVAVDETISIGSNRSLTVGSNEKVKIGADRTESVGSNESITIGANKTISVAANHTESVGANMSVSVGSCLTETVAINYAETVGAAMELTVGGLMALSVGAVMTQTVGAAYVLSVGAVMKESVAAGKSVSVGGAYTVKVGAVHGVTVAAAHTLKAASISMTADESITLKTGSASIHMESGGAITIKGTDITIKGSDITINGSGKISGKAGGDIVLKGSNILQN